MKKLSMYILEELRDFILQVRCLLTRHTKMGKRNLGISNPLKNKETNEQIKQSNCYGQASQIDGSSSSSSSSSSNNANKTTTHTPN